MGRAAGFVVCVCALAACSIDESGLSSRDSGTSSDASIDVTVLPDGATGSDAADALIEVTPPPCNPKGPFATFTNLGTGVNSDKFEGSPSLSNDELIIYFHRDDGGNALYYAMRNSTKQPFGTAQVVTTISNSSDDISPSIVDGLKTIYFASQRNGLNNHHLFQAAGNGSPDGFSNIAPLTALNWYDTSTDVYPSWAPALPEMWFASNRLGSLDIYVASAASGWLPNVVTPVNTAADEATPTLSASGLTLFFGRVDPSHNNYDVWVSTRTSLTAPMSPPTQVADFNTSNHANSAPSWLSIDGCRMYFSSDRDNGQGDFDVWMATRAP
jgi:hypothetical protein